MTGVSWGELCKWQSYKWANVDISDGGLRGELRAVALGKLFEVKCYLLGLTAHGAGENAQA